MLEFTLLEGWQVLRDVTRKSWVTCTAKFMRLRHFGIDAIIY